MRVIELHFNPKAKEDRVFDSFCFEPENVYEKRLGNLYLVGELTNVLPQNSRLLDRLARVIQEKFYQFTSKSSEKSLKESLKQVNEFLDGQVKKENVSWLGNLNFAILSLNGFELNFTKVGNLKVLLLREGQITDIGKNLEFEDIEPYPLKIFGNIASGKLVEEDRILVLTKEALNFFNNEKILQEIASLPGFEEKKLREILKKKEKLSEISGICLLINLKKEALLEKPKLITFSKKVEKVTIPQIFFPFKKKFSKSILTIQKTLKNLKARFFGFFRIPKFSWKIPKFEIFSKLLFFVKKAKPSGQRIAKRGKIEFSEYLRKNLILIAILILIILIGFLIFHREREQKLEEYQIVLAEIEEKINQAESFLIIKDYTPDAGQKAEDLLEEAWAEIQPLVKDESELSPQLYDQILSLKKSIEENLGKLNNLEIIEEPQLFFEFDPQVFLPQKMVNLGTDIYFFNPASENLFKFSETEEGGILEINRKFNLAIPFDDAILFFVKPNILIPLQNDQLKEQINLETPYPDVNFKDLASFYRYLYFLESKQGKIIKYPPLQSLTWGEPQLWLKEGISLSGAKSMAIDSSIWILKEDNSIDRYYKGEFQESPTLDLFPYPQNISKIFTSPTLPYLYLLEPAQNRIIILTKQGEVFKQYQSDKFDNLLDFSISPDGKTIYLLNGLKVYQIRF